MNTMIATQSTDLHQRRVRLTREPLAAGEARSQVRAVIRAWRVPVDPDIAVLLASDLVTHAITHGHGETITLGIGCSRCHLRIDVYETSSSLPTALADTETGRGLVLIAALSTEWGSYLTAAGKAVYFTLAFRSAVRRGGNRVVALAAREPAGRESRPARRPH